MKKLKKKPVSDLTLYEGDCLELMSKIKDKSVDMILCDLPYGQTARNKWDVVIPFRSLWSHYERIIKDNGAIVLFGNGMFTSDLMQSNKKMWRYNLIWDKVLPAGHLNANRMPLRQHEDICVFYKKLPTYNPQKTQGKPCHTRGKATKKSKEEYSNTHTNYGLYKAVETLGNLKHPTSILSFSKPHPSTTIHPTQKSEELCCYLIKTYTNKGDIVLDNCMGSGTTGRACIKTNRKFIGIEKESEMFKKAKESLLKTKKGNKENE